MAPTTLPARLSGTPPAKIMMRPSLDAWIPKNWPPDWDNFARSFVERSKAREVKAFLMEISMLPIQASSIRTWATRFPPASATAMFIGCSSSFAFLSAAAITLFASSSVNMSVSFHCSRELQLHSHDRRLSQRLQVLDQVGLFGRRQPEREELIVVGDDVVERGESAIVIEATLAVSPKSLQWRRAVTLVW